MKFLRKELEPEHPGEEMGEEATMTKDGGRKNTFLGKGCAFEGKLTFEGVVTIDGRFTGEIFSDDVLEVGPDADLKAEVDVGTAVVGGRVLGNIHAKRRVDLRSGADVTGNITAPIVTMQEGALLDGAIKMSRKAARAAAAPKEQPKAAPVQPKPMERKAAVQVASNEPVPIKPKQDPTSLP